jgi:hypothetical protein
MLTTAELLIGDTIITSGSCMLDTGALEASFISQSVIDSSSLLQPLLRSCSIAVTLGDGQEEKAVSGILTTLSQDPRLSGNSVHG